MKAIDFPKPVHSLAGYRSTRNTIFEGPECRHQWPAQIYCVYLRIKMSKAAIQVTYIMTYHAFHPVLRGFEECQMIQVWY